jgi:hypothetical protein
MHAGQQPTLMSSVGLDSAAASPPLREPAATLTASGVTPAWLLLTLAGLAAVTTPWLGCMLLPTSVVAEALMGLYSPSLRPALQQGGDGGSRAALVHAAQQTHTHTQILDIASSGMCAVFWGWVKAR